MKHLLKEMILILVVVGVAGGAFAQQDKFGKPDTVYADVAKVSPKLWTITLSLSNDEYVTALSIPLKITGGLNRIVADSGVYTGGRVQHFTFRTFRCDTAIQCITLGMIANLGPTKNRLKPGAGRLATVFVSSMEDKAIEKLSVDTTTTSPNNSLMAVADTIQGEAPDTTRIDRKDMVIVPVFITRQAK